MEQMYPIVIKRILQPLLLGLLVLTCIGGCRVDDAVSEIELNTDWLFKSRKDTLWAKASVPGTVHTDLLSNGKIEDPYYRLNEHDVQWIDKLDWEYKTTFSLTEKDLSKQHIALDFLGLDTYSSIYLNDTLILQTDNMFRSYAIEVKHLLTIGVNKLHIVFDSPIKIGIEKYDTNGFVIPVSGNDLSVIGKVEQQKKVSVFTRKAGYHFGWDWGPRLVSSGIWRPIKLRSWDHHKIDDLFIQQDSIGKKAHLTAFMEVDASFNGKTAEVELYVNDKPVKTFRTSLKGGVNQLEIPFEIEKPMRWWPNGMGEQILYKVEAKLTSGGHVDRKWHNIGLRTLELVREPDSMGVSFYFKVNGYPVFMKGANYIPQDVFLPRAKTENYEHILSSAKQANMNMLRVWGGGVYESDEFYQLCDEKGLLVWQDFMFACAMYPGDKAFLENVKQEAIQNVKRLRNHSSIALWCGNNEIIQAWENWGWKDDVVNKQSQEVVDILWKSYDDLFHTLLPEVIAAYDPSRAYWPSSPGSDFGKDESMDEGDAHYWWVWWGKKPFENYNTEIPRFMSEYGFQSFPALSTVKKYALPQEYDIYSEVMKSHQRSSIGNETIEEYLLRDYRKPKDFESFLYVSQLLQAHGITIGIEAHRRNRDRCMGSLYWQINDCWPVASWSSIDYYGTWKASQYAAKKSFQNLLISAENNQDNIDFYVISDTLQDLPGSMNIRLIDFHGNVMAQWEKQLVLKANSSNLYFTVPKESFSDHPDGQNMLLEAKFISFDGKKVISEKIVYLAPFKDLDLPTPQISYEVKELQDHFQVVLRTQNLAKNVFVSAGSGLNFSDNYFDMLPNTTKTITVKKDDLADLESFRVKLNVTSLVDTY